MMRREFMFVLVLVSALSLFAASAVFAEEMEESRFQAEAPPALVSEGYGMEVPPAMAPQPPMMPPYYPPAHSPYYPVVQYRPMVTYYPNPYYQIGYGMPPMAPPMPPRQAAAPPVPVMPTKMPAMLYSNGTIVKPKVYVPGFPIRNVFQAMTP